MPIPTPQQNNNGSDEKLARFLRIVEALAQKPTELEPIHQEDVSHRNSQDLIIMAQPALSALRDRQLQ